MPRLMVEVAVLQMKFAIGSSVAVVMLAGTVGIAAKAMFSWNKNEFN